MLWTEKLFKVKKPIIALLHMQALPGDPAYTRKNCMKDVVEKALKDLMALQNGGVDGILFSNEFSLPYQRKVDFVTPASMARVIGELMRDIRVPYGVDCISDGYATVELAAAVDAAFVRGTFSGVYVGDGGFYNNDFSKILRRKAALGLDELKMLYFLNPESDINLDTRKLPDIAKSLIAKAKPDSFCISANAAGNEVADHLIADVKSVSEDVAVFCNTGCNQKNIAEKLATADAACVGTTFKFDGDFYNLVDEERVRAFMDTVKEYRANFTENV